MELNREQVVKDLERWAKNYDGKMTNFITLCNAVGLIEKLDNENKRLQYLINEVQQKLTDTSEFMLRADHNGAMYYVDHAAWVEEITKEILEENNYVSNL